MATVATPNLSKFTTEALLAELDHRQTRTTLCQQTRTSTSPNPSPLPPSRSSSSRSHIGVPACRPRVPRLRLGLGGGVALAGAPSAAATANTCTRHFGETDDSWCESHGVSICQMCRQDHPTCKTYDIDEWYAANGPAMESCLAAVLSRISAVEDAITSISDVEAKLSTRKNEVLQQVVARCQALVRTVQERYDWKGGGGSGGGGGRGSQTFEALQISLCGNQSVSTNRQSSFFREQQLISELDNLTERKASQLALQRQALEQTLRSCLDQCASASAFMCDVGGGAKVSMKGETGLAIRHQALGARETLFALQRQAANISDASLCPRQNGE